MHTYYLQAATESATISALEAAGLAQAIPAQTITEPEHQAQAWADVTDEALIAELDAAQEVIIDAQHLAIEAGLTDFEATNPDNFEHNGVEYFDNGIGWMTLETVTVPERTVTTPAYIGKTEGVHLVMVGTISKRIGGTDEEPIMETLPGYHVNLHLDERYGDISDEQRAMLPIIAAPKNPVSVLAGVQ